MSESKILGTAGFNPFADEIVASPYDQYRLLQIEDPVHWSAPLQAWVLTRFDDVATVLNDQTFQAIKTSDIVAEIGRRADRDYRALVSFLDAIVFLKNGQTHQRDRRTMAKVMSRMPVNVIEASAREIAASLTSSLAGAGSFDAISAFADPFPQLVMAHILGIPKRDVPFLSKLLGDLTLVFDQPGLAIFDRADVNASAAMRLLISRIRDRKILGAEGLDIIYEAASDTGEQKLQNAAATALFAYRVGAETTIGLIGSLLRAFLDYPELREIVTRQPETVDLLVSEVLRLESNVQRIGRMATEPRQLRGKHIKKGQRVLLLLGAANRDPQAFSSPDQIKLDQRRPADLAFGIGSHFCLGANLARMEARIAVTSFLDFPVLQRAGKEKWYTGRTIRRLTELPVQVT